MSELSVFVDESGDVGANSERYLVTLVFHDQSRPIDAELVRLGHRLGSLGVAASEAVHASPIIRQKEAYANMEISRRKKIFTAIFNFCMGVGDGISYATLAYRKSELGAGGADELEGLLENRMARDLKLFLGEHLGYFTGFDHVIVYYDNGQHAVTAAVREAFTEMIFGVEFRLVEPSRYRLFQVADLVCTLELLRLKDAEGRLTRSDLAFFGSPGRLRRNYLRHVERLRMT